MIRFQHNIYPENTIKSITAAIFRLYFKRAHALDFLPVIIILLLAVVHWAGNIYRAALALLLLIFRNYT
jgi:hypothetical protein